MLSVRGYLQNQHDLSQLAGGLDQTPFGRSVSLNSCKGVLQVLDALCTPYRRVWCILELHMVVVVENKHFEVVTMIPDGRHTNDR